MASEDFHRDSSCCLAPLKTLAFSFKILIKNPKVFVSIFALTTLPLSVLLFSQSLSAYPIKSRIYHLEAVADSSSTRFEARVVCKESRGYAVSLVSLNALFFLPCYALSLLAAITAVHSAALSCGGKRPTLDSAVAAVRTVWKRTLVTTICVYVVMQLYRLLVRMLTAAALSGLGQGRDLGVAVAVVAGSVAEVYLMAVLSTGVVASVVEEQWGWDAISGAWGLMAGRRFSGWVLSAILASVTWCIGVEMEETMKGGDWWRMGGRNVMEFGYRAWLVCLYAVVMLWSFILITAFYCECRRGQQGMRGEHESEIAV